jgi:hypothetical protein
MTEEILSPPEPKSKKGFSGMQVIGMVIGSMCIAIFATAFAIKLFLFPSPFKPVVLSAQEEQHLATKLEAFDSFGSVTQPSNNDYAKDATLNPEQYSEEGASRKISFSERELNSIIAKNTDLADKLAIDLGTDMVSLKLLIPLDPDFPMLGGKTLKVKTGAELAYREGRPVVKLKGLSLMGVPMPNAWLGGLKNIDLIQEFGADEGFWKTFSDGVESISVDEGALKIQLKE